MTLTEIAIKRPSLIIVLFSVLLLSGLFAFQQLGYELMPDFDQPVITVRTVYPGAAPDEVESSITRKIEDALSSLEHIDDISSMSMENASMVVITFTYGANVNIAMQDAQRQIDNIKKDLPPGMLSPVISKISPNDLPIMQLSALSTLPNTAFYQKMKDDFIPQLQKVKGVAEITLLGGEEREIQVSVDQEKLRMNKVSILQVTEAIKRANMEIPAGKAQTNNKQINVKLTGKFAGLDELKNLVISYQPLGSPVYLKDVAEIKDGINGNSSVSRFNGQNGIGVLVKKQRDANAVDVSRLVKETLHSIEEKNQTSGVQFNIADDNTELTVSSVNTVIHDLEIAVLLVAAVMLLFLHSMRNSLIVLVAIPASLVSTFGAIWLFGYTLNLMTLLAMSLVIGILVDDSIVVLENIQRHLEMGKDKRAAALSGRNEIGFAALSITLVDVVVFLPITFVNVVVADLLRQFSVVVVVSTLLSLLISFTLTPWLASRIGKAEHLMPSNPFNIFLLWFEAQMNRLTQWYGVALEWSLRHKMISLGMIALTFVGVILILRMDIIGKELIAAGDQGKFKLSLEFDKQTPMVKNNLISKQVEDYLLRHEEVKSVFSNVGGPTTGMGSIGIGSDNKTELTIQLRSGGERKNLSTEQFMMNIRKELRQQFSGIDFTMTIIGLVPRSAPVEMTFSGENYENVMHTAHAVKQYIVTIPGANDVQLSVKEGNPELRVDIDREKMSRFGLNIALVGATLRNALAGNDDAEFTDGGTQYTILISLDAFNRKNSHDVENILFTNAAGYSVRLAQFARVYQSIGPSLLERKNRNASVTLTADALGRGSGSVADDIISYLSDHPMPSGVAMVWGGDIKRQNDSFGAMGGALIASLILVYLIMVALYDNFLYPFVVLFSIPVAVIGAFLALGLTMSNISVFTLLGMIMLLGLVAKNAILIVDFTNHLKLQGLRYEDALIEAGKTRLRPILMTTVAMVTGMIPIAMAKGTASEWKNGLAWVLIGGLTSSMLLTVFLVPIVYYSVDSAKEKISKWTIFRKIVPVS